MEGDIFATKGLEYLLVILYFALLIGMALALAPRRAPVAATAKRPLLRPATWFALADGYHFHQGHSWAADADGGVLTVGLDDFAAQFVGPPDALALPAVGARVQQGEVAWRLGAGERTLPMLSPVEGEVVAVNADVMAAPKLATEDPYGRGWLFQVRPSNWPVALRNLLSGEVARAWIGATVEQLRRTPGAELGVLMPDGGAPMPGFGRVLGPEEWRTAAREFFLTG